MGFTYPSRQKHQFGVLFQTIYQNGLFLNYLPRGSVFICIAPKTGTQFNEEMTCDIELCCVKSFAQQVATASTTTFGQAMPALSTACIATAAVAQPILILFFLDLHTRFYLMDVAIQYLCPQKIKFKYYHIIIL